MNPVIHFEIPAADRNRAVSFYQDAFGWDLEETAMEDEVYKSVITSPVDEDFMHEEAGAINGAIIERDDIASTPIITIDVSSIDEHRSRIEAAGGTFLIDKTEVPEMGYHAYFEDPDGNVMGLWETMEQS